MVASACSIAVSPAVVWMVLNSAMFAVHGQVIFAMAGAAYSSQPSMAAPPATVASASMWSGVPWPCASQSSLPTAATAPSSSGVDCFEGHDFSVRF